MRFLIDAQLPPALCSMLTVRGHSAEHVRDVQLRHADDGDIWDYAKTKKAVIITKDEDFPIRQTFDPNGPKVIWLRIGNCTNNALRQWLTPLLETVIDRLELGEKLVEVD